MNAATVYILIMLISAIGWHYAVRHYGIAVIGSTLTIVLLFQIAVVFSLGYFEPFFTLALVALGMLAACIALIIGVPFLIWRKNR